MIFIDLYDFSQGSTHWRYTSSTRAYTHEGNTYSPIPIGRGNVVTTDEVQKNILDVTLDFRNELANSLLHTTDNTKTYITLYRSMNGSVEIWFKGTLSDIVGDGAKCKLTFSNVFSRMKLPGLRRVCSKLCPLTLYGSDCLANPLNYAKSATVVSVNEQTIVVSFSESFNDGYFENGYISTGLLGFDTSKTLILSHTGSSLILKTKNDLITVGSTIQVYPGCDKKVSTCKNKFANLYNYGGFPSLITDNPFSSSDSL